MTDLAAFVRRLAESVAAHDPSRLRTPLTVAEIVDGLMPYRSCRSALGLESAEEYELLMLRLLAEEGGLAQTFPAESAERCRVEVAAVLPDLAFLQQLREVTIALDLGALSAMPREAAGQPSRPELVAEAVPDPDLAGEPESAPVGSPDSDLPEEPEWADLEAGAVVDSLPEVDEDSVPEATAPTDDVEEPVADAAEEATAGLDLEELEFDPDAEGLGLQAAPDGAPEGPAEEEVDEAPLDLGELGFPSRAIDAPDRAGEPRRDSASDGPAPSTAQWGLPAPGDAAPTPTECPNCARTLPRGRPVRFCPSCGQNVHRRLCAACRAELEPDWRHCVMCGHPAGDGSRFA